MSGQGLQEAQNKFRAKHGQEQTWRFYASVESVIHGAPMHHDNDPWRHRSFMGTAEALYDGLAEVGQLDATALGEIISKQQTNRVGSLGWGLLWEWHVAVYVWSTLSYYHNTVDSCIHGSDDGNREFFTNIYEQGMRGVVSRELLAYYFDHTEHSRDVQAVMREAGYGFNCDAHGVSAYFGRVADMDSVRRIFGQMANVPGRMELKTFMSAVDAAYEVAKQKGHGTDLREMEGVGYELSDMRARQDSETAISIEGEAHVSIADIKRAIISVVTIMHQHQNELGVRIADSDLDRIASKVKDAPPSTIKRLLKDWLPSALVGASVSHMLGSLMAVLG